MLFNRIGIYRLRFGNRQTILHCGRAVLFFYVLLIIYFLRIEFATKLNLVAGQHRNMSSVSLDHTFFIMLDEQNYILSAYFDDRNPDINYIRFISVHYNPERSQQIPLICSLLVDSVQVFLTAEGFPLQEEQSTPWKGYMHSCSAKDMLQRNPGSVKILLASQENGKHPQVIMDVKTLIEGERLTEFAICVAPLHKNILPEEVIEFMEATKLLGNNHIYIYFDGSNKMASAVLNYYKNTGYATIHRWDMHISTQDIGSQGEVIAMHHCLYSHMSQHKYIMFQDIDELLIPHTREKWWPGLLEDIDDDNYDNEHCGFCFQSAYFPPNRYDDKNFASRIKRTDFLKSRSKCIVRPERVLEMGVNHISKWVKDYWTPVYVDTVTAFLHLYGKCEPDCIPYIYDDCVTDIADQLETNVNNVQDILGIYKRRGTKRPS